MMEDMGMTIPTECYTPSDLEDIFVRACEKVLNDNNNTRCQTLWEKFSNAFGYKDPNTVTGDDYDEYFSALMVVSAPSTNVFWSSVINVVRELSKSPSISSSFNQESSSIINTMITDDNVQCWCGNDTSLLDTSNPCPMPGPTTVFWQKFSCLFGESASGTSFWLGYGDKQGGAYQSNSFFANYEFPKMTPDRVSRLVAIDMYDCNNNTGEKCGEGTLAELQNQAVEKYGNITGYRCYKLCGNPQDDKQASSLANFALNIIREEQQSK